MSQDTQKLENGVVCEPVTADTNSTSNAESRQHDTIARVLLTDEDNKRIRRKTDRHILTLLIWIYFLQILDKSILGYGQLFGLSTDTHLVGNQYSILGSIGPILQLAWQPFSSILLVRIPPRTLMPILVLGWGIAQASMAACHSFSGLMAARAFLGLFEAGCLPMFSIITVQWYRRSEQPLRVAAWYGTNGISTIVASALSYGLAKIDSPVLASWQIIFLFTGLVTIASVPLIPWRLDNNVEEARFLTEHERSQALERLRANQTGAGSTEVKWSQVTEALLDIKTWLFFGMSFASNLGSQVVNIFGPLILNGLGFDKYTTSLLNMPFGAMQWVIIMAVSWAAIKAKWRSLTLAFMLVPIIVGLVLLYVLPRDGHTAPLLVGYYFLAFMFGCNNMIVAWIMANTAGQTKKSVVISMYQGASAAGNIVGPLLFEVADKPGYHPGLRKTLGVFIMMAVLVALQVLNLWVLNRVNSRRRVASGKPAQVHDHSMTERYVDFLEGNSGLAGDKALTDTTDRENEEFVYVY